MAGLWETFGFCFVLFCFAETGSHYGSLTANFPPSCPILLNAGELPLCCHRPMLRSRDTLVAAAEGTGAGGVSRVVRGGSWEPAEQRAEGADPVLAGALSWRLEEPPAALKAAVVHPLSVPHDLVCPALCATERAQRGGVTSLVSHSTGRSANSYFLYAGWRRGKPG